MGAGKTSLDDQSQKSRNHELFQAISKLQSIEEVERFLVDLCTPAELRSMADRWQVAKLLVEGVPYRTIYEQTGVSTATVTRVARSLEYGSNGYKQALEMDEGNPHG